MFLLQCNIMAFRAALNVESSRLANIQGGRIPM